MSDYYGPTRNDANSISRWMVLAFLLVLLAIVLAFVLNWANKPLEVMSPDNIQRLSQEANDKWQALLAQEASITVALQRGTAMIETYGEDRSVWPQGKADEFLQIQQQVSNLVIAYNASCAQYNALWQDEWRSVPAPDDLPKSCDLYSQE